MDDEYSRSDTGEEAKDKEGADEYEVLNKLSK